ncbi:putative ABC transport system permease protein [Kribbella sp. VKM Ac-2527]|uniref:Putative ABC transport system permease protein n=1 Tax=Kribbella caucasensis TaxID=2512215 RepID=A0A4R6KMM0_9ACTN|nr:ABC transporter permease [Kribbella sp. VKM Ac-2527]TDO52683.1 putative ABC transport system permease protein [Kribbella sp. VKM Ac-2527]
MFTATLRGMLAHKVRLALTVASIALGVAFLAGTLVLTDTMRLAFDQLFGKVSAGTDAVVRAEAAYSQSEGISTSRAPIPASVLNQVRQVDGVRTAEGAVSGYALLTDNGGKAVLTSGGAPTLGYSLPADPSLRGDVKLLSGNAPSGAHQVAIDATSAEEHHIALGSTIKVLFRGPTQEFTVVGTVGFGGEKNLGGTTGAYFDSATAQQVLGAPGFFDAINVSADAGVAPAELVQRIDAVLPDGTEAVTGATVVKESTDAVNEDLRFVGILFMIFAGIALFVGSFIIWNTFTMTITQRSREIALLRAIGATRRQVNRSLIVEALLLGVLASSVGIGLGLLVAKGLKVLMDVVGFSLPSTSMQVQPRTIIVSLLVGTLVTVVAALVPAYRATKVLPVEALREAVPGSGNPSRKRIISGAVVTVAGLTGLFTTLYADATMKLFGPSLLAIIVGVLMLLPAAARPLASLIGVPLRLRGLPGELARQNAMRNPRRTSSTAAALMVGLTLVVSMGVFASSLKASFGDVIGDSVNADLFVTPSSTQAPGFSPEVINAVKAVPGVGAVAASGWGEARFNGADSSYAAVDPATAAEGLNLGLSAGSVSALGLNGVVVSQSAATSHGWKMGDVIKGEFAATGAHDLKVVGIYNTKGWIGDDFIISIAAQTAAAGQQLTASGLVKLAPGADQATVQQAITAAMADHPDAKVLDRKGYEKEASGFIDKLLTFVTVMLLLAVLIALLGIVNTLVLSVFERTRELGLLRAVGMTRAQVRAMVRWESVVISLIGALAGAALGIGLGLGLSQALADEGIKAISIPGLQVTLYVVLAAVAGVLAAIGPARSAAKVDVLKAVVAD